MEHIDVQKMIDEAIEPYRDRIVILENLILKLEDRIDQFESTDFASADHYHDELASADHVERSEGDFKRQIYRLQEKTDTLEYKINDVERKAERAQSAADDAKRSARGGW